LLDCSAVIHEEEEEYGSVNEVEEEGLHISGDSFDTVNDISNQSSTNHHIMDSEIPHPVVPTVESTPLASTYAPLCPSLPEKSNRAPVVRPCYACVLAVTFQRYNHCQSAEGNRMIHPPLQKFVDGDICSTPRYSSVTSTWGSAADNEPRVSGSSNEAVCESTAGNSGLAESKEKKKTSKKTPSSRMLRELGSTLNSSYWMASGNQGSRRSRR
jgi:hypothetical protein